MGDNDLSSLSLDGLCDALYDRVQESALFILREQKIDGAMFVQLTEDDLKELFPQVGARLSVSMVLRERRSRLARTSDHTHISPSVQKVQDKLIESTQESSRWVFSFDIPERFTRSTMKDLASGSLTSTSRSEIVNAIHTRMLQWKEFPTPFEYRTACRRLVEKYPCLVDKTESGYGTWKEQVKLKFRNGRRGVKRDNAKVSEENEPPTQPTDTGAAEIANKKKRYTGDLLTDPTPNDDANYY